MTELPASPYDLFRAWLELAGENEPNDPNAMNLATADSKGRPANRMVLLNGLDDRGFVFFTNAQSRKGGHLTENPYAALCFHWKSIRKQIRIEGRVEIVSEAESDAYYNSRPRQSRIGSWASQQSRPLDDFSLLEEAVIHYEQKFEGREDIPRPDYWKGFRVIPERVEFWINGEFRLHKRYVYEPSQNGWQIHMIYP